MTTFLIMPFNCVHLRMQNYGEQHLSMVITTNSISYHQITELELALWNWTVSAVVTSVVLLELMK